MIISRRVIFLLLLVSRSKLVPDFAFTIHFIHFLITSFYSHGLPANLLWWALQATSAALMTFLGMWACQWRELRPIAFGGSSNQASNSQTHASEGDTEAGIGLENLSREGRKEDDGKHYNSHAGKG